MAGLTLEGLFKTIEETIESRDLDNSKPEFIKRKLLQLSELQTALNKRTVGQVSNEALRRNISEIKEKIIKCEDELWLSFSDDYCLYGDFSDIISVPSTFTAPRAESTLPAPQDESLMIFGLLDELDVRSMKLRLYRHLSQLANEHATQHGSLHNWSVRLAVFNRRNSALNRINKQLQRVKRKSLKALNQEPISRCPLMIRVCNRVLTALLMRHCSTAQPSNSFVNDVKQLWTASQVLFASQFATLWSALDTNSSNTSLFVLGQLSAILLLFESSPTQTLVTPDVAVAISHALFNYFVSLTQDTNVKENITQKMIDDTSRLLMEMSRDRMIQHEEAAWSAPLSDWLMSLLNKAQFRKAAVTLLVNISLYRNSLTDLCHVVKLVEAQQSSSWLVFEPNTLVPISRESIALAPHVLGPEVQVLSHIATDGNYYFVRVSQGFFKLGTGEGGTHRNFVYHSNLQASIKMDDGVTHAPLLYFKSKLVCLTRQRGRSALVIINGESLKEEKTIELKEDYLSDSVRMMADDERMYIVRSETTNTASESSVWLIIDEYTPSIDWSAMNHVTRVKLSVTSGIEELIASSFSGGVNEPYSPSMQMDYPETVMGKFMSITAMPPYHSFSFEELRWNYLRKTSNMLGIEDDLMKRMLLHIQDHHLVIALSLQTKTKTKTSDTFVLTRAYSLNDTKGFECTGTHLVDRVVPVDINLHPIIEMDGLHQLNVSRVVYSTVLTLQSTSDSNSAIATFRWIMANINQELEMNYNNYVHQFNQFDDRTLELLSQLIQYYTQQASTQKLESSNIVQYLQLILTLLQVLKSRILIRCRVTVEWTEATVSILRAIKKNLETLVDGVVLRKLEDTLARPQSSALAQEIKREACEILTIGFEILNPRKSFDEALTHLADILAVTNQRGVKSVTSNPNSPTLRTTKPLLINLMARRWGANLTDWSVRWLGQPNFIDVLTTLVSECSAEAEGWTNVGWGMDVPLFKENSSMPPLPLALVRGLLPLLALEDNDSAVTTMTPVSKSIIKNACSILKSDWNHHIKPLAKPVTPRPHHIVLSLSKQNLLSRSSPGTLENASKKPHVLIENNITMLKQTFIGTVLPYHLNSLVCFFVSSKQTATNLEYASVVLPYLVKLAGLLENMLASINTHERILEPEFSEDRRRKYSWLIDLHHMAIDLSSILGKLLILGEPVMGEERKYKDWLKCKLFLGGLHTQFDHFQENYRKFLNELIADDPNVSKFLQFMFAGTYRPLGDKGGPEVDRAERAVIATLLKHNNVVEEAMLMSQMVGKMEPKQTKSLQHIWDKAYKMRTWILEQSQKSKLITASEDHVRHISELVTKKMNFLLQLAAAAPGHANSSTSRAMNRSASHSILIGEETASNKAKVPVPPKARSSESITVPKNVISTSSATKRIRSRSGPGLSLSLASLPENEVNDGMQSPSPSAYNYLKQSLKREIIRSKSERVFDQHSVEDDKQHRYERIRYSFKMWRRLRARLNQEQENSPRQHVHEISDLIISFAKQDLDIDKFSVIMSKQRSRAQHRVTGFVFLSNLLETLQSPTLKYSIVMQLKEALANRGVCYYYLSKVTTCGSELTEQLVKAFERFYAQLVALLRSQDTPSAMKLQLLILLSVRFRDDDHNFLQEVGMFNVLMRMITSAVKTPAPVEAEYSISPREKIPEESRKTLHYGTWLLVRILTIVCMRREELPNQPKPIDELQKQIFELVFSQIEKMSGRLFHVLQEDQVGVEQDILSKSESRKKVDLESSISSDDELDNSAFGGLMSRQSSGIQMNVTDGDVLEIAEGAWLCYDLVLLLHIICKTSLKALSYMSTPRLIKVLMPFMLLGTSQLQAITISLLKKVLPNIKPKVMSSLLRDVARDYHRKDVPQGVLAFMFQLVGMSVCPALVIHLNPHTALAVTEKKLKDLTAEVRPVAASQPFSFEAPIGSSRSMPNLFNVPLPTVTAPQSQGFQFTLDWPQTQTVVGPQSPPSTSTPVPNFDFNPFAVATSNNTPQSPPERRIRRAGRFRTQQQGSQSPHSTGFNTSTSFYSAPSPLIRIARDGYTNMALAADIISLIRSVASTDQWKQRVKTSLSHALNGLKAVKTPSHSPHTTTTEALVLSPSASVVWEAVAALMAIGSEHLALRVGSRVGLMFKTAHNLDDTYKTGTLIELNPLTGKGKVAFSFMEQPVTVSLDKLEVIDQADDFEYKQADLLPILGKYLESKEDYFNDVYWENNAEVLIYCRVKSLVILGLTRLLKSPEAAKEFIDLGLLSSLLDTTLRHAPKLHALQRYEVEYYSLSLLEESVRHHNMLYKWNQRLKSNPLAALPIFVPYKWSTNYQGSKYMSVEGCEGLTAVIVSPKDMLKRRRASSNLIAPYSLPGFYFEVEINCLDAANGVIEVGLCDCSMHLDACDFKTYHTYRNTGQKYWSINSAPELFGSKFGHGDVVGCGWDMDPPAPNNNNSSQTKAAHTISYFWTLNGRLLDYGYRGISAPSSRGAFAVVIAKSVNGKITANFGQKPFLFNLAAHWSDRWTKLKAQLPSPEHSPRNHSPREQPTTNSKLENAALSIRRSVKPAKAPKSDTKTMHTSASRFALVPPDTIVLGMVLYVTPRPVTDVKSSDMARVIAQTAGLAGVVLDYDAVQSLVLLHVLDPALGMHITAWYPLSAVRCRASNTRNEYNRLTSNIIQLQQRNIEVLQVMWSIHAQDALINILQHNSNHVLIYRQLGADKLFELFKIIYLRTSPDNYVQHNERSLNILLDFFTSILRADSADQVKPSSDKFGAFLLSTCIKHKFWFANFSSKKTVSEIRREFDMACTLLRLVYREGDMTVKKKYRLIVFLFFIDYLRKPSRPLDMSTKTDIVVLVLEIMHRTGIAPSPGGVPHLNDIEWLREEVGQLYDELIVRHESHSSKAKLNYLKALVELMLAIRAIGWDTSAEDMDVFVPVTVSPAPVLTAPEVPLITTERLDATQSIDKPKVTAHHVFNPVVQQSVFHQITLWTRVIEQLTPQMIDIPSALVIEAFIYNKTRRTFNFKVDNEPHEGMFDMSSRARVIPLNIFTRDKLTLYQVKENGKEALKLGEQSYVSGPVVHYSIQPLSVKEKQQLCSIALIPQLDLEQKAKWIHQDPALPNLIREIAGIDQVVTTALSSPRSPGRKIKPGCSGLWLVLVELVALLNCRLEESTDITSPYAVWPHLPLKESEKVLYPTLWAALDHATDPSALLTHLTAVIHVLNGLVEPVSNLFQLEDVHDQTWRTGHALLASRVLLFRSLKWSIIQSELKLMTDSEISADPPITLDLNRFLTAAFNPTQNNTSLDENCIFLQAYAQLKNVEAHKLFNHSKSWHVKFKNEEGIDSGGLFRESLTLICNDLQSNRLPIFIPCPNAQLADKSEGSGHNRNKWIPNPSCSHPRYQKLYEFVGRLLGLALWTDNTLPLDLPSFVWKPLLGQELSLEDLKDIDSYCGECLSFLTSDRDGDLTENNFNDIIFEYFQTVLSDGTVVDLKPNGAEIPVTYANRLEYVNLVQKTRLRESAKQLQWMRQGLSQVVPVGALSLLSWSELQDKVTGVPTIDINLLRQHTRYELFTEDDPTIVMFWKVLTSMRQQERRLFLRFVWGRETLPSPLYWREEMVVSKLLGKHDELPQSHTCFFVLKLPTYSSEEIMSQKLIMAITHTQTIDTDFNL